MKIATLGPSGTFSHEAALRIDPGAELLFQRTIRDVFAVTGAGGAELGLVPLENSVAGSIGETLDALMESELTIVREHIHPVVHHLAALGDPPAGSPGSSPIPSPTPSAKNSSASTARRRRSSPLPPTARAPSCCASPGRKAGRRWSRAWRSASTACP